MQKNFNSSTACALERAIKTELDTHPERGVWNWSPEALSVCRYTHGGRAHYKVAFPDQYLAFELEPAFLTLTLGTGPTARLLRDFKPGDFMKLQQLVDNSSFIVTRDEMRAAVARYNDAMNLPAWRQAQYRHQQRGAQS